MPSPKIVSHALNPQDKFMLKAFFLGTQTLSSHNGASPWSEEAITGIQEVLSGKASNISKEILQEILLTVTDILSMEARRPNHDKDVTKLLEKLLHHVIHNADYSLPPPAQQEEAPAASPAQ